MMGNSQMEKNTVKQKNMIVGKEYDIISMGQYNSKENIQMERYGTVFIII